MKKTKTPEMHKHLSRSLRQWDVDSLNGPVVLTPDNALLNRIRAESPYVPKEPRADMAEVMMTEHGAVINLKLTVAEQRRIVELEVKQPCVRLWLTLGEQEFAWKHAPDFTHGQLKDGRFFCWRRQSDLNELRDSVSPSDRYVYTALKGRILTDDIE